MNPTRAIVILTAMTIMLSTCEAAAAIGADKRKRKRRKENKQRRQPYQHFRPARNEVITVPDPEDLTNILGTHVQIVS